LTVRQYLHASGRTAMQIPPPVARAGALVRVRRLRWRVADMRAYDDCQVLTLSGIGATNAGTTRCVIAPFDRIEPIARPRRLRLASRARWRRACRSLIADSTPPGALRAARDARIDLLPYQLEPALAIARGLGSRLLLADAVGLGKTIQAGLVLAELLARGVVERILVLAPAGLRDQWADELSSRFSIDSTIVDACELRRRVAHLAVGVNPWATLRAAVVSVDYAKRPETLPSIQACPWDVLVMDEAHAVAGDTDRRAAVEAIATRAAYVLLLSATPHSGDRDAFLSLCSIGAHNDRLLAFRRTRCDVGIATPRHIHRLHVGLSAAETEMHAALQQFTRAVRAEHGEESGAPWLALSVLHKRALSSAWSLAESVARRLSSLAGKDFSVQQLPLPLAADSTESDDGDRPPDWPAGPILADPARECRLLETLGGAARAAAASETKISALRRLLRRVREPVVVFTEFRDTLLHVDRQLGQPAAILYGGLTRAERTAALNAFANGGVRLLLTTDAGGEGINLQRASRVVVNLELPWNPMRLEQRIGRVDRIGQARPVHAFHLIARESAEAHILGRLRSRIASAQEDIGGPDPIDATTDLVLTARILDNAIGPSRSVERSERRDDGLNRLFLRLEPEAAAESVRLAAARRLARSDDLEARASLDVGGPWLVFARNRHTRSRLGRRLVGVWIVACGDDRGITPEAALVPVVVDLQASAFTVRERGARWLDSLLSAAGSDLGEIIEKRTAPWRRQAERVAAAFNHAQMARAQAAAAAIVPADHDDFFQAGLFDRRADRLRAAIRSSDALASEQLSHRIAALQRSAALGVRLPQLLLVLAPRA
jgi:superfamily II DNA or RNA helicase